jgi:hypothetical protein
MVATIVVVTGDEVVLNVSCEPFIYYFFDGAGAPSDDLNADALEDVDGTFTHVACQHGFDAFLGEDRGDVGFAAASFRRIHGLGLYYVLFIVESHEGVVIAMAEVIVDISVTSGEGYFHDFLL